jgi:hypothetical protein
MRLLFVVLLVVLVVLVLVVLGFAAACGVTGSSSVGGRTKCRPFRRPGGS